MSFYKEQLKDWLKEKDLKANSVLSVGNMNDDLKYFKSVDVKEIRTVDINKEYNPDYVFDLNEELCIDNLLWNEYDCILAFELFEYLWNPVECFKTFNKLLKSGGELWLSVPFLYPHHNPTDQDYLRVTEWGIKKLLKETGFEIIDFEYRRWRDPNGWFEAVGSDGMRFAKDYKNHNATGFLVVAKKI